jgi:outer membrane protein assembly factor BamB
VACWNSSNGTDLWKIPTDEFQGVGDRMISSQFVMEDSYAAVVVSKYQPTGDFTNSSLVVLDARNGNRLFADTLPNSKTFSQILRAGKRFILSSNQEILIYEK